MSNSPNTDDKLVSGQTALKPKSTDCDSEQSLANVLTVEQALAKIFQSILATTLIEKVDLEQLNQRVLAQDIVSPINVPPANNSAMDGYAVCSCDFETAESHNFTVVGNAYAGEPYTGKITPGDYECVRIMTGGLIPDGADAVIMQENATAPLSQNPESSEGASGDKPLSQIQFSVKPQHGLAVRYAGEDITKDALVFSKGHIVRPIDIGVLASLGIKSVSAFKRPKVGIISTGDELVQPGTALKSGQIYDSNRFVLDAFLRELGVEVYNYGVVEDNLDKLMHCFSDAAQEVDVLLTSGGVSVGEADYTKTVLDKLGQVGFWKIAMKPGKPLAFGKLGKAYFIGLPGNPVSSVVTFQQIARSAILKLAGASDTQITPLQATVAKPFKKRAGRTDFQRAIAYTDDTGHMWVKPMDKQNSGVLTSISSANCYVVLAKDSGNCDIGTVVNIQLFSQF